MILLRKQPAMCMRDTGVTGWNSYVRDTVYDPRFRENSHGIDAARYSVSPLKTTVCTAKGCVCCCFYRRGMIQIRRHNNILGGQKYDLRKKQNTKPDHHPARYIVGARTFPPGCREKKHDADRFSRQCRAL